MEHRPYYWWQKNQQSAKRRLSIYFLFFILIFSFLSGCEDEEVEKANTPINIPYDEVMSECANLHIGYPMELVVSRQTQFDSAYAEYVTGCTKPLIDMRKSTIIGIHATTGGCSTPRWAMQILQNDSLQTIQVNYRIIQNGPCEAIQYVGFWVNMPKLPSNYSIIFSRTDSTGPAIR